MTVAWISAILFAALSAPGAVVIGGIVGGLTGLAGSALTAHINSKSLREERNFRRDEGERDRDLERLTRLREQMLQTAAEFSTALGSVLSRLRAVRRDDAEAILAALDEQFGAAQSRLGPIFLLFGPSSDTADRARTADFYAARAIAPVALLASLDPRSPEPEGFGKNLSEKSDELSAAVNAFTTAAGLEVELGPPWARRDRASSSQAAVLRDDGDG